METTVETLAEEVQGTVWGERTLTIHGVQAIEKAGPHDITFLSDTSSINLLERSRAGAAIVNREVAQGQDETKLLPAVILVDDAQLAFIQILQRFRPPRPRAQIGVSPVAQIGSNVTIGDETNIYPGAYVGNDVTIGDRCDICPGACLSDGCRLGDEVTIYANAVLYPNVTVGHRVIIHACAVLGADGFGYRFADGQFQKIPQLGSVRIEDDVEIGAGTTIDRGMIGPTVVGQGSKLDNQVMIGHNCELGSHNAFASQVGLAGSVTTGNYVRCAGQVGIADHIHLGEGCTLLAKAGVHRDIPAGETCVGAPARPKEQQIPIVLAQAKLPEVRKQLRSLVREVADLKSQLQSGIAPDEHTSRVSQE